MSANLAPISGGQTAEQEAPIVRGWQVVAGAAAARKSAQHGDGGGRAHGTVPRASTSYRRPRDEIFDKLVISPPFLSLPLPPTDKIP